MEDVDPAGLIAAHPLHAGGYDFKVPLLEGDHVTEDTGTGFVHTAPSHGGDDFEIWTASTRQLNALGIDPTVPDMVGPDGYYRKAVPLFGGGEPKRVIDDKGHFGKLDDTRYANAAVIAALKDAGALAAMNPRHKHDYAAFLAVESAGHLSQHAAMVHRDGQAERDEGREESHACATRRSPPSTPRASCRRRAATASAAWSSSARTG